MLYKSIDLVGDNWILDYKSDRRFQLWVYARALKYDNAHIAYLRHDSIRSVKYSRITGDRTRSRKPRMTNKSG